jgi:hypothetical protein
MKSLRVRWRRIPRKDTEILDRNIDKLYEDGFSEASLANSWGRHHPHMGMPSHPKEMEAAKKRGQDEQIARQITHALLDDLFGMPSQQVAAARIETTVPKKLLLTQETLILELIDSPGCIKPAAWPRYRVPARSQVTPR